MKAFRYVAIAWAFLFMIILPWSDGFSNHVDAYIIGSGLWIIGIALLTKEQ